MTDFLLLAFIFLIAGVIAVAMLFGQVWSVALAIGIVTEKPH